MLVILMNAAVVFMMYFPEYANNRTLELIDNAFLLFFMVEAIVKIAHLKPKQYFAIGWNRFDFAIVIGSLPSLFIYIFPIPNTALLIILRLFRLIRLVRFIRFIPNLDKILEGLGRALKASVFVLIALFFLNFLLAIFTCHFYGAIAPEHFGNPLVAAYSIFQMFTVEGWYEIPQDIADRTDSDLLVGITRFYFVMIVLIGGIFGMSLANAIFVDEMTMDNNRELEDKIDALHHEIAELKNMLRNRPEDDFPPQK